MIGSVEKDPRFPISVPVLSIDVTAGASMSCFFVVAEPLDGPRDAEDISEARLVRPEPLISRSWGNMASRLVGRLSRRRDEERRILVLLDLKLKDDVR